MTDYDFDKFGDWVRYNRKKRNLLVEDMQEKFNVSEAHWLNIEHNNYLPNFDLYYELLEFFNYNNEFTLDGYYMFLKSNVREEIAKIMKNLKLTRAQLAKQLNVSISTVKFWEEDKKNISRRNYSKLMSLVKK